MRTIRCCFVDFWPGFDPTNTFSLLYEKYTILLDDKNPDYVIYSDFGKDHLTIGEKHLTYNDRVKIFWTNENDIPDFNYCDYAIAYIPIVCDDRCFRHHNSIYNGIYNDFCDFSLLSIPRSSEELLNRKFCNFVYSNAGSADPMRKRIFEVLSAYKRVDAGGEFLNNMGDYRIPTGINNKIKFQSEYKFTLAVENSSIAGYTTEKILHPFIARSLPVYWGNPQINKDYKSGSFINIMDYSSLEEAVEEIIRLDQDDAAYLEKVTAPFWTYGDSFEDFRSQEQEKYLRFFQFIFDQPLEQAVRKMRYGRSFFYMNPPIPPSFSHRVKNKLKWMTR